MEKFYITTSIPYVNAKPHLGHVLEFVQADVITRYHRLKGEEVLLLSGSDENALKNVLAAERAEKEVQEFVDEHAEYFRDVLDTFGVRYDIFQKGSDQKKHFPSSQELWKRCFDAGDIYKKSYEGLYCVGCEAFYALENLTPDGECFEHPGKKLENISEENYFFRLSKYQKELIDIIKTDALNIFPRNRKNEVLSFLKEPLQDISISRSNERAKNWGVPVPGDSSQRMYVWFDALNIYQSGIGFGWNEKQYEKWWPCDLHVIGKGIIRFHAVYWPAFLLSARLPLPKGLFVHGYITVEGQKMSKSVGNVVDPLELVKEYGVDPIRYYLLREIPSGEDGDFSRKKFEDRYNGDLANGIGNLVARVATLGEKVSPIELGMIREEDCRKKIEEIKNKYKKYFEELRLHEALGMAGELASFADKYINEKKPWTLENLKELGMVMRNAAEIIGTITDLLEPFLPETSLKIREQISVEKEKIIIKKAGSLFPRRG